MSFIKLFLVLILAIELTFGSKILIIHPMFTVSHWLTLKSLADSLVTKGHAVHVIKWKLDHPSPYEGVELHNNLSVTTLALNNLDGRYFGLSKEKEAAFTFPDELVWKVGTQPSAFLFSPVWRDLFPFFASTCETILSNTKLTKKLRSEEYDLAIVDMVWNECSIAYVRYVLEIPITVGFWGISPETLQVGPGTNFLASSYFPFPLTSVVVSQSAIIDRLVRRMLQATHAVLSQLAMRIYFTYVDSVLKSHNVSSPNALELQQDLDGVLINFEPKLEIGMRPLTSNFLTVGGLQIISRPKLTEIPTAILNFMNESDHVILFSLGATLNPERAPRDILQTFFDAFKGFPNHRILFQYGGDPFNFSIPRNIKLAPWFPQQHILAHPKTVLFINHCGLQGVTEAVHFGVPLVCMPVVTDAHETLHKILFHNIGLGLNLNTLRVQNIEGVIRQVLFNPIFKSNVDELSELIRDAKETPLERTITFLEQLIRFKGTRRLSQFQMPDQVNIFEYFYLDILFVVLIANLVGIYVTRIVFKQARLFVSHFKGRATYRSVQ